MVSLVMPPCFAANIKLLNGTEYDNVTVLRKDARTVEVLTQFGKIEFPLSVLDSIDGVSVRPTPPPAAAIAAPPAAVPSPTMQGAPAGKAVSPPSPAPGAGVSPQPAMAPASSAESPAAPTPAPWPPYEHRWTMDLLLLGFAVFAAMWIGTVGSVQRSLYQRRVDPRFWSNVAIVLPGLGYLAYQAVRGLAQTKERMASKRTVNEMVASREKTASRQGRGGFEFLDEDRKSILIKDKGDVSGLEHAHEVLEEALLERASDVHIDPAEDEYRVRFRVDGVMQPRMNFGRDEGQRIVSALKTLAQIDVAEKRKAQDGRFRVRTDDTDVDFRVATANSIFGEKLVIRILNRKSGLLGLRDLGMPEAMLEQFARVIHSRSGMILATGPTGSGKTSTLYSALSQLDAGRLNIMTIEDPVEYGLPGATQIPVNVKAGITYESGLRSILRQDPDVIFVGEMRDAEAAQVALRAALTGHLVFSSLHTRDAVGTIIRLEEMGMDRHMLASSLLVLIAQRLLRVLCPECREECLSTVSDLSEIGIELPEGETIYRAKGCKDCGDTGYMGRTGIFEMIVFDEELRHAVNAGEGEAALTELARGKGVLEFSGEWSGESDARDHERGGGSAGVVSCSFNRGFTQMSTDFEKVTWRFHSICENLCESADKFGMKSI
jgi:general secretion pathway protein E